MPLNSLPNELLFDILSAKAVGRQEMTSLVRVNKWLHKLLLPLLYHSIKIHNSPTTQDSRARRRLLILRRVVSKNHLYGYWIRHLEITISQDLIDLQIRRSVDELLISVPMLETLELQLQKYERRHIKPWQKMNESPLLPTNSLRQLRALKLSGSGIGRGAIAMAMQLPKLEKIEISSLNGPKFGKNIRSAVKEISFGLGCDLSSDVEEILSWPTNLEKLSFQLSPYHREDEVLLLSKCLIPLTDTLRELQLKTTYTEQVPGLPKIINFATLSNLRKLDVASQMIFPRIHGDNSLQNRRNGLYSRLPASLEHLMIFFENGRAILDELFDLESHFQVNEDYDWIEELAINKAEYLPRLTKLVFTEWTEPGDGEEWEMPVNLRVLFDAMKIQHTMTVRNRYNGRPWYWQRNDFVFKPSLKRDL